MQSNQLKTKFILELEDKRIQIENIEIEKKLNSSFVDVIAFAKAKLQQLIETNDFTHDMFK